ncbi:MAG: hypothetical protein ABIH49_03280 [archaeon]
MDTAFDGGQRSGLLHVYSADFSGDVKDITLNEGGFCLFIPSENGI